MHTGDGTEGSLTGPSGQDWFTEEMVEEFCRTLYGPPWGNHPLVHEPGRRHVAASFRAIAPMVTKWVGDLQASEGEMMREAGYRAGRRVGLKKLIERANSEERPSIAEWLAE